MNGEYVNPGITVVPGCYETESPCSGGYVQQPIGVDVRQSTAEQPIKRTFRIYEDLVRSNLYEKRKMNSELATKNIVDVGGDILIERRLPGGEYGRSTPICKLRGLKSFKIQSKSLVCNHQEILQIVWPGDAEGIFIAVDADNREKMMMKKMLGKGVEFLLPPNAYKQLRSSLFAFFYNKAEPREVPDHVGWNQLPGGGWEFVSEAMLTWRALYDKV